MGRLQAPRGVDQHQLPLRARTSCATSSPTPTWWHSSTKRKFSPRVAGLLAELPDLRLLVSIDDGSGEPLAQGSVPYEEAVAVGIRRTRLRTSIERRPLHPLHRRDHRHAQRGRLAARGRVLRTRRRSRPDHQHPRPATRGDGREGPWRALDPASDRATDARRDPVVRHGPELRRQQDDPRPQVRPARGLASGRG